MPIFFGFKGKEEDTLNKYEYNPLTKVFTIDQLNTLDDSAQVKEFCLNLDFKKIVEPLIIKPIINPLNFKTKDVTREDILLLKQWVSIRDSVRCSIYDLVGALVGASVRDSIWNSVHKSVWDSVRDSIWNSVPKSIGYSIEYSIRDLVWDYCLSFLDINYVYDFSCIEKLYKRGFIPSFNEKMCFLFAGEDAKIAFKISVEELLNFK